MIDYEKKTYANILADQLKRVPYTLDKREGSIIQTALGPVAWYMEGIYLDLLFMQNNVYADTAAGIYLDRMAAAIGITRKPATFAVKKGVFDKAVPIKSRFSAALESINYTAVELIGSSGTGYEYKMKCETAGEAGNNYTGQLLTIDYVPGLTKAELTEVLIEGVDEEDDEALRKRILTMLQKPSTSGNKYDYYNWAMECAGVGAAKVFPLADGPGTVKVVIADASMAAADSSLLKSVKDHIEELRPIGATLTVASAVEKGINVSARVKLGNGLNLGTVQNLFRAVVEDYLKDHAFDLSYVSLARIGNLLLDTAGIEDYTELLLNGMAGNVALSDEEIAVAGTVTLEVM
ncbi:MAG: baseplate J/gp47 family protein [Clostridiaceae bacterium]|nr:baseplate J/gp47 family protein [Clostridiaceae bacterium]